MCQRVSACRARNVSVRECLVLQSARMYLGFDARELIMWYGVAIVAPFGKFVYVYMCARVHVPGVLELSTVLHHSAGGGHPE